MCYTAVRAIPKIKIHHKALFFVSFSIYVIVGQIHILSYTVFSMGFTIVIIFTKCHSFFSFFGYEINRLLDRLGLSNTVLK